MTKVTLLKAYRERETLKIIDLEQVVDIISSEQLKEEVFDLQNLSSVLDARFLDDGSNWRSTVTTQTAPSGWVAPALGNRGGRRG